MIYTGDGGQSQQPLKILFLDVDGTLNRWTNPPSPRLIESECAENLNAILDATGAKVVVTASCRHLVHSGEMTVAALEYLLRSHGVRCSVVGVTEEDAGESDNPVNRGRQIRNWLRGASNLARASDDLHLCEGGLKTEDDYFFAIATMWNSVKNRHGIKTDMMPINPTQSVVLDDVDDGITASGLNLVQVNGSKGLTAEDAQLAIEILNG